jgi:hypothetical protein
VGRFAKRPCDPCVHPLRAADTVRFAAAFITAEQRPSSLEVIPSMIGWPSPRARKVRDHRSAIDRIASSAPCQLTRMWDRRCGDVGAGQGRTWSATPIPGKSWVRPERLNRWSLAFEVDHHIRRRRDCLPPWRR